MKGEINNIDTTGFKIGKVVVHPEIPGAMIHEKDCIFMSKDKFKYELLKAVKFGQERDWAYSFDEWYKENHE